ncbi:Alpha/Beta hydrolase protein [Polychytrium aggregatum]|uniref:Alpha/Beta hydrolase protein n=1 Tax=Polychytrium aggregatum TaxID=110093 RepID=UPI0022FE1111|nr:Alpha/Beta hydrolase protein [Polychytrium aggregatum]KAI9205941.1 Alpha/Beta hydrolase protein [Polychytrium aggregatum]
MPSAAQRLHSTFHRGSVVDLAASTFHPPKSSNPSPATARSPLLILHGLFGSKQNWRSIAKGLAGRLSTDVIALDLRNHGESPHADAHDYELMAADVAHFIQSKGLGQVHLMGHSMGGKVAMHLALTGGTDIEKLIVVDMSPVAKNLTKVFGNYVDAMLKIEAAKVQTAAEADAILKTTVPELPIRQFILTNLKEQPGLPYLKFRVNLATIHDSLEKLWAFPYENTNRTFDHPTLFLGGKRDRYVSPQSHPAIQKFFPKATITYMDTGHWIHAEKPEEFMQHVTNFLKP